MTGFRSCCGYPHGPNSMYAMILGISSYLLALSSSWGCYFATVDYVLLEKSATKFEDVGRMGLGLFSFEDKAAASDLTCRLYSTAQLDSFDNLFKAARAIAILANIFIGMGMIFVICLSCLVVRRSTIKAFSTLLLIGGILEGFTFLVYASDAVCGSGADCEFFFGSGLALLCSAVTLVNALITYHIPEAADDGEFDKWERNLEVLGGHHHQQDVVGKGIAAEEEEEMHPTSMSDEERVQSGESDDWTAPGTPKIYERKFPDGRRHIVKTIVNQDGSRTVEEITVNGNAH